MHLADWPSEPWRRIAHDAWQDYDREATSREYGGVPPKMRRLPWDTFRGFEGLFNHVAGEHFEKASRNAIAASVSLGREIEKAIAAIES